MLRDLPITFPFQGLSENFSFSKQAVGTSRDALNMRGLDPLTGRLRGAQRPGWAKYNSATVNGSNGVVNLGVVVGDDSRVTYSEFSDANIETVGNGKTAGGQDCLAFCQDFDGNLYGLDGDTGFTMWNPEREVVASFTLPVQSGSLRAIAVDQGRNVYVSVSTGGTQSEARLWKCKAESDGSYTLAWELSLVNVNGASGADNVCYGTRIKVVGTTMYVAVSDLTPTKAEAEVHVYNGVDANAAPTAPSYSFAVLATETAASSGGLVPYGMDVSSGGDIAVAATELNGSNVPAADQEQYLVRYDSTGSEKWKKDATTVTHGGFGLDCKFDANDGIAALGSYFSPGSTDEHITVWADGSAGTGLLVWKGPSVSADFSATPFVRLDTDKYLNVYVPWPTAGGYTVRGYDEEGTEIIDIPDSGTGVRTYGVLVPVNYPDYGDDAVEVPEFLHVCFKRQGAQNVSGATNATPIVVTTGSTHDLEVLDIVRVEGVKGNRKANGEWVLSAVPSTTTITLKGSAGGGTYSAGSTDGMTPLSAIRTYRLVDSSISTGSQRTQKVLAVAGGNIEASVSGTAWTAPTGGTGALASGSEFISGVSMFGKRYYTDGLTTVVYDLAEDEVTTHTATKGEVPQRCKLLAQWRERLVHARSADDGHNWFMSAAGDQTDYDYNPVNPTATTAVAGNLSDAGRVPDIINSVVPWSDDLLFFLCDHSIWRLTGDPQAGGVIDNVSQTIGGAFGASWARDPLGVLYFFSTEGGIYRMTPVGLPERISVDWIERRLQNVDLSVRHARLEWDFRSEGLVMFLVARDGSGGTQTEHYFWEQKTAGWWPMKFGKESGATNLEPLSTLVLDGDDPDDRLLLIGCEDGYVRQQSETQKYDVGSSANVAIDSYVTMGPFTWAEADSNLRTISLQVTLADKYGGANWELFASDRPDVLGDIKAFGKLSSGRSPNIYRARTVGQYFWLRLRNADEDHWAFENASLKIAPAGRKRVLT